MQAIACLILFTFVNVLSTLLAKLMASHFHKATHFHKMQEAIRKVRYSDSMMKCLQLICLRMHQGDLPDPGPCTFTRRSQRDMTRKRSHPTGRK